MSDDTMKNLLAGMADRAQQVQAVDREFADKKRAAEDNGRLAIYEAYRQRTAQFLEPLASLVGKLPEGFTLTIDENVPGRYKRGTPGYPHETVLYDDAVEVLNGHESYMSGFTYDGYFRQRVAKESPAWAETFVRARLSHGKDQLALTFTWQAGPWAKEIDDKFALSQITLRDEYGKDRGWDYFSDGRSYSDPDRAKKLGRLIAAWALAADPAHKDDIIKVMGGQGPAPTVS